jgi:hypothetical protein
MEKQKTITWGKDSEKHHNLLSGWCKTASGNNRIITSINHEKDKQGGYIYPYVNTPDGTYVILDGDKVIIKNKKIVKVIQTK